jgi:ABC-type antimicrobial peptide transport system, ATPase component
MNDLLRLESISKAFPGPEGTETLRILSSIDFSLQKGESVAVEGKSGSGKSTFLSVAALLSPPTAGEVFYHGRPSSGLSDKELSALRKVTMGFVFQNSCLLEDFSALENVAFPLMVRGVKRKEAYEEAAALLEKMGLGERLSHRPALLSGGERQRVAVSRALIGSPEIIFADEPTGALDEESAAFTEDLLLSAVKERGQSLLLVTHNPSFASKCDKTYILENKVLRAK